MNPAGWVPERAEIIYIQHTPHAGTEMPGVHPLLVVSTRQFNEITGIVIGFPMTHSQQHESNPFAVRVTGPKDELGYVVTNQPKSFDWRVRAATPHPWGSGHTSVLGQALEKLDTICGFSSPLP
jgi:mRNA interferase MazF